MLLMRKYKTMSSLTPMALKTFFYCLVHIPLSGALLRLYGYKYLISNYWSEGLAGHCLSGPTDDEAILNHTLQGFMLALKYSPYRGTCLSRAVLVKGLLQRRKFATKLQLGVNLYRGEVSAHAWLESDFGYVPVGHRAASAFIPMTQQVDIISVSQNRVG